MDSDLLKKMENVVLALGPLYSNVEGETLKEMDNATLSRSISTLALRTMILEIEITRREENRKAILKRLRRKYFEYRGKYREFHRQIGEGGKLQALHDELKEKYDELVRVIKKCSVLEGKLRSREDELEVSSVIDAQCGDLQTQVVELCR
uniref:Uncharacterized protein n=1 Tax=Nicotiana tabacum TaxID=4097 RepID=A0A1S4A6D6_TOBAC|nr:PREDICTED: uncharacterized protein LOC107794240 [Nicotiana tabacum]